MHEFPAFAEPSSKKIMRPTIALLLLTSIQVFAANQDRSLPIFFIPNSGQTDRTIRYIAQTPRLRAGFALDSVVFQIHGAQLRVRFAGKLTQASL